MKQISLDEGDPMWVHADIEEGEVNAAEFVAGVLAATPPDPPDAPTERLRNLWKELLNRATTGLDGRLSIQADWNPALHPRGPGGKFVSRPFSVPDALKALDSDEIVRELAEEDPDFAEKVDDLAIDGLLDVDESLDEALERADGDVEFASAAERREAGVDTVPFGEPIEPEAVEEGQWIGWRQYGNRDQMQVTEVEEDINGNMIFHGEGVDGTEGSIRPESMGGKPHETEPVSPFPDIEMDWPDDIEDREAEIEDALDRWVPVGNDAVLDSADSIPMDKEQWEENKPHLAHALAVADDSEVAQRAIGTLAQVGDDVPRNYDGSRGTVGGVDRGVIALSGTGDNPAVHEMGHRIGKAFQMDGNDNRLAWSQYDGDIPTRSEYGFSDSDMSERSVAAQYAFDHPDDGDGDFLDAWGIDQWKEKVDTEVGTRLDGRNFSSLDESGGWLADADEGSMIRFDENPVAGFTDDEESNLNWRIVETREPESPSDERDVVLENWKGDQFEATVHERPVSGYELKTKDMQETKGFLPDVAGKRDSAPEDWGMFDKDPDQYLGGESSGDIEDRMEELAVRVNESWYRQAKLLDAAGETEAEMATIISSYSATNAHETLAQLHEVMQASRSEYERSRAARALVEYHPELLEAYRHVFDIPEQMADPINERLDHNDAEFRVNS